MMYRIMNKGLRRYFRSFGYAWKGIAFTFKHERNFQLEIFISIGVVFFALLFPLSGTERALIILAIALVLALELANTALERVMDILKPRVHPYARVIKDTMAGAVLLATIGALTIGITLFAPYVERLFGI
ncbi:MAG: diacylglycerol kinase [Minisyncoccota bacterium]